MVAIEPAAVASTETPVIGATPVETVLLEPAAIMPATVMVPTVAPRAVAIPTVTAATFEVTPAIEAPAISMRPLPVETSSMVRPAAARAPHSAAVAVVLPAHARLREELLGLVYEVTASGVRVVDRGRVHQDHAVCLRMVCAMLHDHGEMLPDEYTQPWAAGRRPLMEQELRRRAAVAARQPATKEEEETPAVWGSDDRVAPYRRP